MSLTRITLVACPVFLLLSSGATAQSVTYNEGVLVAFREANSGDCVVRYSPDGLELASGSEVYRGKSTVTAMIPYRRGVITAFRTPQGKTRVHFSADGKELNAGEPIYDGTATVTALSPFSEGVLISFVTCQAGKCECVVRYSQDGRKDLASGEVVYRGASIPISMCPFRSGVATSFAAVGEEKRGRVIVSDGKRLNEGTLVYDGRAPVTFLAPFRTGLLATFVVLDGGPPQYVIRHSDDGLDLGDGSIRYKGESAVCGLIPLHQGVMVAFTRVNGNAELNRVHFSPNGENLADGKKVFEGRSRVLALSQFTTGNYQQAALVGDPLNGFTDLVVSFSEMSLSPPGNPPIPNGCGDPHSWLANPKLVPQFVYGADLSRVCNPHDICYGTPWASKQFCDGLMAAKFYEACLQSTHLGIDTHDCVAWGGGYVLAVKWLGQGAYDRAQMSALMPPQAGPNLFGSPPSFTDKAWFSSPPLSFGKVNLGVNTTLPKITAPPSITFTPPPRPSFTPPPPVPPRPAPPPVFSR